MIATEFSSLQQKKKERRLHKLMTRFLLVFCIGLINFNVAGQTRDSSVNIQLNDTTQPDLILKLRKTGERAAQRSQTKFKEEQVAARQDNLFEKIKKITDYL